MVGKKRKEKRNEEVWYPGMWVVKKKREGRGGEYETKIEGEERGKWERKVF